LAGTAPVSPQVDDHRHGPRPHGDVVVEGLLGDLEDIAGRGLAAGAGASAAGSASGSGSGRLLPPLRRRLPRAEVHGTVKGEVPGLLHTSILPHAQGSASSSDAVPGPVSLCSRPCTVTFTS